MEEANEIANNKNFDGDLTVCFVGRLDDHKGVGRILDSFKQLPDIGVNKIIFVGDGADRKLYEERAKALKMECLFTGGLSRYKIIDIYKESHIFCLPSTASEGFPKVIAEAAAYGCVPVVSDISSIGQFIKNGNNGVLLHKINPEYIAEAFTEILENREHLKYLSSNVVNIAKPFTYDHYNSRIINEVLPQLK